MKRRFSIPVTKRSFARNKIPPRIAYDSPSDDVFNLETDFVLAKMRTMTPEEAAAFSAQAVAEAEVAMIEAADAMWEAAAAEAQAAAAVRKEMKARKHRKMKKACMEQERSSD